MSMFCVSIATMWVWVLVCMCVRAFVRACVCVCAQNSFYGQDFALDNYFNYLVVVVVVVVVKENLLNKPYTSYHYLCFGCYILMLNIRRNVICVCACLYVCARTRIYVCALLLAYCFVLFLLFYVPFFNSSESTLVQQTRSVSSVLVSLIVMCMARIRLVTCAF